jgi:hypothetical protein
VSELAAAEQPVPCGEALPSWQLRAEVRWRPVPAAVPSLQENRQYVDVRGGRQAADDGLGCLRDRFPAAQSEVEVGRTGEASVTQVTDVVNERMRRMSIHLDDTCANCGARIYARGGHAIHLLSGLRLCRPQKGVKLGSLATWK